MKIVVKMRTETPTPGLRQDSGLDSGDCANRIQSEIAKMGGPKREECILRKRRVIKVSIEIESKQTRFGTCGPIGCFP